MARIALNRDEQRTLLAAIRQQLALAQHHLADLCGVHPRTLSDWMRGKYRMKYESFQLLIERTGLEVDQDIGRLPEFSHVREAGRLGGLGRARLYGNPGTPEGRRLGGLRSIAKRIGAQNPLVAGGFTTSKTIKRPELSSELAEFIGMMLGDGCLCSAFQAALYFNTETDGSYAGFMSGVAQRLFGIVPRRSVEAGSKSGTLLFSSKQLVDYLIRIGFGRGDKVKIQAGVPNWILADADYRRHCLRGLMDTDGSVYSYEHTVYGHTYTHIAIAFTNRSFPLLQFVRETLLLNGYHPTARIFQVYLHRQTEVERYFSDIRTHNAKHLQRYQARAQAARRGAFRRGIQVVDGAALEKR